MTDGSRNDNSNSSRGTVYENSVLPEIDPRFECPMCLNCLTEPVLTSCGHRFCKECIHTWLRYKGGTCPIDEQQLSMEHDLFIDNCTKREISQLRFQCPVEDCAEILPLVDAESHVTSCHQTSNVGTSHLECTFRNVGCEFEPLSINHLKTHLESDLHNHLALISSVCSGLTNRITGNQQSKSEESKLWEPNPKQNDNSKADNSGVQQLLRDLYERIVLLEQRNREQEINLRGCLTQISKLELENEHLNSDLPLRVCNGEYVWRIPEFPAKLRQMKDEPKTMFYSSGFYTSYHGYRFCARMNLNDRDPNFIMLNIHVMQGDNDDTLEWPFSGKISLTLISPFDAALTIRETMMSRPELDAFKRPTKLINPRAFGYANFVSTECIERYIKRDVLVVKIQIKIV